MKTSVPPVPAMHVKLLKETDSVASFPVTKFAVVAVLRTLALVTVLCLMHVIIRLNREAER